MATAADAPEMSHIIIFLMATNEEYSGPEARTRQDSGEPPGVVYVLPDDEKGCWLEMARREASALVFDHLNGAREVAGA